MLESDTRHYNGNVVSAIAYYVKLEANHALGRKEAQNLQKKEAKPVPEKLS